MPELTCPSCGFLLDAEHNFCPSCGAHSAPAEAAPESDEDGSRKRLQRAVGSDYLVGPLIGRGGFAEVFEAEDTRLGRRVAIKVVRPDLLTSDKLLERFQREARAMAGLRHPNVMEIYTVGEGDGVAFFVMPMIDGESLHERIERLGPLPLDEVRRILVAAAGALDAAHKSGTIHRDVKPDNILLEGERGRVLITDFGIAKALEDETTAITGSGIFVGTPRYMSPEQATGDHLDHRSDIYSLGVVAFQMIAGRLPFEAKGVQALIAKHLTEQPPPLWTLRSECPERLARVVEKCLAKDPGERWDSLADMVSVLEGTREMPAPPTRIGVPGLEAGRAPPGAGDAATVADAVDALEAPLEAFRRAALGVAAGLAVLVALDGFVGLGGVSAWVAVAGAFYLAARAARLWSAGYEWRDLVTPEPDVSGRVITLETPLAALHGEDFGRFGSLVQTCTSERATILKAFADVPHQEQKRFSHLRETVEVLVGRVKHLARKVVTLEARIAETAHRIDRGREAGPGTDPELATSSLSRHAARLQELNSARDEAAAEMRACVSRLEDVRDSLTERVRHDPSRAMDELARTLSEVAAYLSERA